MTPKEIANKYANDHEELLNYFPDKASEAKESLACFVANAILSFPITKEEMFELIDKYYIYYKNREFQ